MVPTGAAPMELEAETHIGSGSSVAVMVNYTNIEGVFAKVQFKVESRTRVEAPPV